MNEHVMIFSANLSTAIVSKSCTLESAWLACGLPGVLSMYVCGGTGVAADVFLWMNRQHTAACV